MNLLKLYSRRTLLFLFSCSLSVSLFGQEKNYFAGENAGVSNTTGRYNTFVGAESGKSNTTGNFNNFFGALSGQKNTTGVSNSFFGDWSGLNNTIGYDNAFFGRYSGKSNTTGNSNTFYGSFSGEENTSGNNNAYFGRSTGNKNTTGSNNSFFGQFAGHDNTGSGNVFLGYSAGYLEPGSNKLYIDNSNTSSPLIWGDFENDILRFNGNVGIGKTNPSEKLDVAGGVKADSISIGDLKITDNRTIYMQTNKSYLAKIYEIGYGINFYSKRGNFRWYNGEEDAPNLNMHLKTTGDLEIVGSFIGNGSQLTGIDASQISNLPNFWTASGSDISYSGGNVGIGTTTTPADLTVNGTINATEILVNGSPISGGSGLWTAAGSDISYAAGNVTIGNATQSRKLTMHGDIVAKRMAVSGDPANFTAWPDYVFEKEYALRSISELESYIEKEKHLPEVPSAAEVAEKGFDLGNMDATLLKKVEELTLYIIEQNKRIEQLEVRLAEKK